MWFDTQAAQRTFDGGHDPLRRELRAGLRPDPMGPLNFVASTTSFTAAAQGFPDDLLRFAVTAVDVGGVDHVDAAVEGAVDHAPRSRRDRGLPYGPNIIVPSA